MNGKVLGAISIVRDITRLEELSNRLRVYSHRVAELLGISLATLYNKIKQYNIQGTR